MGSEEELLENSYEFYYAAVKEFEEGERGSNPLSYATQPKRLGTPLFKQLTHWPLNTLA